MEAVGSEARLSRIALNGDLGETVNEKSRLLLDKSSAGWQEIEEQEPEKKKCIKNWNFLFLSIVQLTLRFDYYLIMSLSLFRVTKIGEKQHLDTDTVNYYYGWLSAAFALCAIAAYPIFGFLGDKFGAKYPVVFGCFLMAAGNILFFFQLENLPILLLARSIAGFGSGAGVSAVSYIGKNAPPPERKTAIGHFYMWGMFGMILGPIVAVPFSFLPEDTNKVVPVLSFGRSNTPTLVTAALNIAAAILILVKLENINPRHHKGKEDKCVCPLPGHFILIISNFLSLFCISAFEVLVVPVLEQRFGFGQAKSSAIIYGIGACVLFAAMTFRCLLNCCKIHVVTLVGLGLLAFGCVVALDFNALYDGCSMLEFDCLRNETDHVNNITLEDTVDHYPLSLPIQITLEVISALLCSLGFTWAFISYSGIFVELAVHHEGGKLLPKVGLFMSYMAVGGSFARFLGPLTLAYGLKLNPNLILFGLTGLMILNVVMWVGSSSCLIPQLEKGPTQARTGD